MVNKTIVILAAGYLLFLAELTIILGTTGLIFGVMLALLILPWYLILTYFKLEELEKIVFSFFLSLGIFSSIYYWLSFIIGSLTYAAIVTWLGLMALGIYLKLKSRSRK